MRYHYDMVVEDKPKHYGETYPCKHAVYDVCTLFKIGDKGLAVVQQRKLPGIKAYYWSDIDRNLCDDIYLNPLFKGYFDIVADYPDKENLYPTVTLRSLMWHLRMKPLPRERWETYFDRSQI